MGDPNDEQAEDPDYDPAEEVSEPEEDHGDDASAQPERPPPVHAGTVHVAPSSEGSTNDNVVGPPTSITITVRRDFPRRQGERLGEWGWSSPDGAVLQTPQRWILDEESGSGRPPAAVELHCEDDREIIGWGLGPSALGRPGRRNAGQFTTDQAERIEATIRLRSENGEFVDEGSTRGRDGECVLATAGATGVFHVEIRPEHSTDELAGPGMEDTQPQLYRPSSIRIELRSGRIVEVHDPYDPPGGCADVRIGTRKVWTPTTTQLPVSLKPQWWKDPTARARRGGTGAISMLVLHCTGGSRLGPVFNRFFRSAENVGSHYLLDVDGHAIKMAADDQVKVHAGAGFWGGDRQITLHSLGIEIINPNTGDSNSYMNMEPDRPPYTPEQYATLLRLCAENVEAYPSIGPRILGHCDLATGSTTDALKALRRRARRPGETRPPDPLRATYGVKRTFDPGPLFEWERFEAAGLGMVPVDAFDPATTYAGVFGLFPGLRLDTADADPHGSSVARYGGEPRPEVPASAAAIQEIQRDLLDIGYCLSSTGSFDARTFAAADRFRRHFARESMPRQGTHGSVDLDTARRLHNAAQGVRQAALSSS